VLRKAELAMEGRDLQEVRGDLHDLYDAIGGLGIELEALNMSVRALTAHLTGEDPLRDSLYFSEGGPGLLAPYVGSSVKFHPLNHLTNVTLAIVAPGLRAARHRLAWPR
jgi:hypothetical protein